jgi:hypothetical protein
VSVRRTCDVGDCQDDALFMVGLWSPDADNLDETLDVCGVNHARDAIATWLRNLGDIEELA